MMHTSYHSWDHWSTHRKHHGDHRRSFKYRCPLDSSVSHWDVPLEPLLHRSLCTLVPLGLYQTDIYVVPLKHMLSVIRRLAVRSLRTRYYVFVPWYTCITSSFVAHCAKSWSDSLAIRQRVMIRRHHVCSVTNIINIQQFWHVRQNIYTSGLSNFSTWIFEIIFFYQFLTTIGYINFRNPLVVFWSIVLILN